jgi:flagellar protein FlaG
MNTQAIQATTSSPPRSAQTPAADLAKEKRESYSLDKASEEASSDKSNAIQPEELLNNIKALTEDGLYSVRFEMNNETQNLIINLVDYDTGEVIRQIPPEEIVNLREYMTDLRGNIVNTES